MPDSISVAVVGAGVAAHTIHLPVIEASDHSRLVMVYDIDDEQMASTLALYPTARPASSLEQVCADPGIDAVIVATPPDSHHTIGLDLIRAGKAVLMEKPLAANYEESESLVTAAAAANVPLAVGQEKRFHPTFRMVRDLITARAIGHVTFAGVHWASDVKLAPDALIPEGYSNYWWRWRSEDIGGGISQDHLPHYVDLLRHWTGAEPRRVWAHHLNVARDWLDWPAEDSVWEDMSLSVVEMDDGAVLRLETGVVGRSMSPLLGLGHGVGEWTEYGYVFGTEGKLMFDMHPWDSSETGRIAIWETDRAVSEHRGWTLVEQPEPSRTRGAPGGAAFDTFMAQWNAFLTWVRDPSSPPIDLATGLDGTIAMAVVEAGNRSAATGHRIDLKEITEETTDAP